MKAIRHEFQRFAPLRAQISPAPSLLKEALQEHSDLESHTLCLNTDSNSRRSRIKRYYSTAPQICTCRKTSRLRLWEFGLGAQVALIYRSGYVKDCPAHNSTKNYSAAIRGHLQSTILENLVRLSFEATCGAGGFSMGLLVRTYRQVQRHPLINPRMATRLKMFYLDLHKENYGVLSTPA